MGLYPHPEANEDADPQRRATTGGAEQTVDPTLKSATYAVATIDVHVCADSFAADACRVSPGGGAFAHLHKGFEWVSGGGSEADDVPKASKWGRSGGGWGRSGGGRTGHPDRRQSSKAPRGPAHTSLPKTHPCPQGPSWPSWAQLGSLGFLSPLSLLPPSSPPSLSSLGKPSHCSSLCRPPCPGPFRTDSWYPPV